VQPDPVSCPTVPVAVRPVLQLSVTSASPKKSKISCEGGIAIERAVAGAADDGNNGWRDVFDPGDGAGNGIGLVAAGILGIPCPGPAAQAPVSTTGPVEGTGTTCPQLSVAVAVPRAASMRAEDGLQLNSPLAGMPVAVMTGFVASLIDTDLVAVPVFPQSSVAVKVTVTFCRNCWQAVYRRRILFQPRCRRPVRWRRLPRQ